MADKSFSCKELSFSYGEKELIKNLSLVLPSSGVCSLVGANGSGKTTLFNLLAGLLKPLEGDVFLGNTPILKISPRKRARLFSVVSQGEKVGLNNKLSFPFSAFELVSFGLSPYLGRFERFSKEDFQKIGKAMELTKTSEFSEKPFESLSGGEKQRVLLARAIVGEPKAIFLDEAFSELDLSMKLTMMKLFKSYAKEKNALVFEISHDLSLCFNFSDYIIAMKDGKVTAKGEPKKVITEQFFRDNFSVEAEIVPEKGFFIKNEII